jgi:hypothetical protein
MDENSAITTTIAQLHDGALFCLIDKFNHSTILYQLTRGTLDGLQQLATASISSLI